MAITSEKFRAKLINKIINAESGLATERFIHAAVGAMRKRKVNGYLVQRFVDRVINQLNLYNNSGINSAERNNIIFARLELRRIRNLISNPDLLITQFLRQ